MANGNLTGFNPTHVIFDEPQMTITPNEETRSVRVSLEVSMRELVSSHSAAYIIRDAQQKLSSHLAHYIERELATTLESDITRMLKDELRAEVKRQVKEVVEARIEDFLEEAL